MRAGSNTRDCASILAGVVTFATALAAMGLRSTDAVCEDQASVHAAAARVFFDGQAAPAATSSVCGFSVVATDSGAAQVAVIEPAGWLLVSVRPPQTVAVEVPVPDAKRNVELVVEVRLVHGQPARVRLEAASHHSQLALRPDRPASLRVPIEAGSASPSVRLITEATDGPAAVRWEALAIQAAKGRKSLPLRVAAADFGNGPPSSMPGLHEPIERAMIEWDWRMQDGIGRPREPTSYQAAIRLTLARGDALLTDLQSRTSVPAKLRQRWQELHDRFDRLTKGRASETDWESLWRDVHWARRRIAFSNPLVRFGRLVFVKWVPSSFSHQLTQYVGRYARPGGGVFVLERPGESMRCRQLAADQLPAGSFMQPDVSYDGRRILFAYCNVKTAPPSGLGGHPDRRYHLYEVATDGSRFRQITDGPYDDFSPRYLPDGRIVFISTRRGGWHRCGGRPGQGCENHTLALVNADGTNPHPISFHETQEWDPAVLPDGRLIYTRWDYVDRHAVYYEQLWTTRPDGSGASIYFGNNTFNPVGIWEALPVPGSSKVMATAAAHHAMTAGS
ncbi:MAG TPA: hypothetical protein EYP14_04435, partial [Planctomycetaceae bacterium]|nr:hypothetical protein [Planctomycetaceae bacterium]